MTEQELLQRVELALLANNGGVYEFREDMCSCDPSVGMCPCEYCAIFSALMGCKEYLLSKINACCNSVTVPDSKDCYQIFTKLQDGNWEHFIDYKTLPEAEERVIGLMRAPLGTSCMYEIRQNKEVIWTNEKCLRLIRH